MRYLLLLLCLFLPCFAFAESVPAPGSDAWTFEVSKGIAVELADTSVWSLAVPYLRDLSTKTQDWNVLLLLARVELLQGNFIQAQDVIERALAAHGSNPRILAMAGHIASDVGKPDKAAEYYEKTLQIQPNNTVVLMALARIRYAQRRWSDVIVLSERLLKHSMPTSEVIVRLATAYESMGNTEKAETLLKQNLEVHPNRVLALMPLERFYRRQNETNKADNIAQKRRKLQKTADGDERNLRALLPSSR